jgi:glycosidase
MYEVQTRALLSSLSGKLKREAMLGDIPDTMLDQWQESGFEYIWLLGIWQTGQAGKKISQSTPKWQEEFRKSLPDLKENDIIGSCYAIKDYKVHADFGGEMALKEFRGRLNDRGMLLILDFVPNHAAPDHRWVKQHPEYFIQGREDDLRAEPDNYLKIKVGKKELIFAHGRDPNYPGWPDTLQLDFSNQLLQKTMKEELLAIASKCDGVRCDMAMLLLPDIFEKTWRRPIRTFWPGALDKVRDKYPDFLFLAEVYWNREWEMQQLGFDYCYDKRLYDRMLHPYAPAIRDHLRADLVFQNRLMRFIENHDEPRAATIFPGGMQRAAAVITYFTPGMKFFHDGQLDGYLTKIPVHLNRGPKEKVDEDVRDMYDQLLNLLKEPVFKSGHWRMLDCRSAGDGEDTSFNFLAFCWQDPGRSRFMVVVNYSPEPSRCYVTMPFPELAGNTWQFTDRLSEETYKHDGNSLLSEGFYLDLPGWGAHIFEVEEV